MDLHIEAHYIFRPHAVFIWSVTSTFEQVRKPCARHLILDMLKIAFLMMGLVSGFQMRSRKAAPQALKMLWGAKESPEHFLIAPSILSADFARLGEEVLSNI